MEAIAVVCIHRLKLCFSHLLCWPGSIQNAFRGPLPKQGDAWLSAAAPLSGRLCWDPGRLHRCSAPEPPALSDTGITPLTVASQVFWRGLPTAESM